MSQQSVFEKKYVEKDKMSDVEGVLEQFNLPPNVISFIRKNVRAIQIAIAVVVITTVAVVLYKSYLEKKISDSSNALTLALEQPAEARITALKNVVNDFSGTDAAMWATVELGHQFMKDGKFDEAEREYAKIAKDTDFDDPAHPLALLGQGQAYEGLERYDEAGKVYSELKDIKGYRDIAYINLARTLEAKGDVDAAIITYNEYLLTLEGAKPQARKYIEGKIVRLQTKK